jgi:hypothetical protein
MSPEAQLFSIVNGRGESRTIGLRSALQLIAQKVVTGEDASKLAAEALRVDEEFALNGLTAVEAAIDALASSSNGRQRAPVAYRPCLHCRGTIATNVDTTELHSGPPCRWWLTRS